MDNSDNLCLSAFHNYPYQNIIWHINKPTKGSYSWSRVQNLTGNIFDRAKTSSKKRLIRNCSEEKTYANFPSGYNNRCRRQLFQDWLAIPRPSRRPSKISGYQRAHRRRKNGFQGRSIIQAEVHWIGGKARAGGKRDLLRWLRYDYWTEEREA